MDPITLKTTDQSTTVTLSVDDLGADGPCVRVLAHTPCGCWMAYELAPTPLAARMMITEWLDLVDSWTDVSVWTLEASGLSLVESRQVA